MFALLTPSKIQTDNKMDIEKEVKKVKFAHSPSGLGQKGRRPEKVCRTLVRWRERRAILADADFPAFFSVVTSRV